MFRLTRRHEICIFAIMMLSLALNHTAVASPVKITDVKISHDLCRIVVKTNGPTDPVESVQQDGRSKLAINVPNAILGDLERTIRNPENGALEVKLSRVGKGVQLVLDFGKSAVPEHRIRNMQGCLMVFLDPWEPKAAQSGESSSIREAERTGSQRSRAKAPRQVAERIGTDDKGGVSVLSAEVIDGLIVLQVVDRKDNPGQAYRISLGVDFDQLGFKSATISPQGKKRGTARHLSMNQNSSSASKKSSSPELRPLSKAWRENAERNNGLARMRERIAAQRASGATGLHRASRKPAESKPSVEEYEIGPKDMHWMAEK